MKKFLLTLLILVMFTPSLACAQFMQPQTQKQQRMAMADMAKDMPCCPEDVQKSDMSGMLFKDCAKVDLQHVNDAPLLKKVDTGKVSPYILPQEVMTEGFGFSHGRLIRGPPDPPEIIGSYPPIFLTTLRLRI